MKFVAHERFQYVLLNKFGEEDNWIINNSELKHFNKIMASIHWQANNKEKSSKILTQFLKNPGIGKLSLSIFFFIQPFYTFELCDTSWY